jgi:RhtB (resistance to homoserine/threonine) family protein
MAIHDLWLFLLAGVLLNVTPGQDMALIIARSTQYGTRAGVLAALGVGAGAFVHITAAAIGISTLIVASALAFAVLKWLGAAYLTYLGVQMLRASMKPESPATMLQPPTSDRLRHVFLQGVLSNALNPKVAVFFLAFLPQFVDAEATSKVASFITLGLIFNGVGTTWNIAVACFAARLARSNRYGQAKAWLQRAIGALFVLVGVRLALADPP